MWSQQPNDLPPNLVRAVTALVVLVTIGLSALALLLQQHWRGELGGPREAASPIRATGVPPSDLFYGARPEQGELPSVPVWVDRERGIVALPLAYAVELARRERP